MRALVSVYDKEGLVPFVSRLTAAGYEIVSSGGTATYLADAGLPVTSVEEVTGSPEILGGRVKTLHPKIHGGILARGEADLAELEANDITPFDLVVCNLYPFRETVARPGASESEIIEKIDIGGPAMVRAAAKNHHHVTVVVSPTQYDEVASAIESGGPGDELRRRLAADAFFATASYDAAIVGWLGDDLVLPLRRVGELRYGENPHQKAGLYREDDVVSWWSGAELIQGKEMSFNNYADAEAAWSLASDLGDGAVVVVKHTNPAGAARGDILATTFDRAWAGRPAGCLRWGGRHQRQRGDGHCPDDRRAVHRGHHRPGGDRGGARGAREPRRTCASWWPPHPRTAVSTFGESRAAPSSRIATGSTPRIGRSSRRGNPTPTSSTPCALPGWWGHIPSPTPSSSPAGSRSWGSAPAISPGLAPPSGQSSRLGTVPGGRWRRPMPSSHSGTVSTCWRLPG